MLMMMDVFSVVAGLAVGLAIVLGIKKNGNEFHAYPMLIATMPLYYIGFAIYGGTTESLIGELLAGIPFLVLGLFSYLPKLKITALLLAVAWVGHGVYDLSHEHLFINQGIPGWFPLFCAVVDVFVGLFLAYYVFSHCAYNWRASFPKGGARA